SFFHVVCIRRLIKSLAIVVIQQHPTSTLFPYTTLFRSEFRHDGDEDVIGERIDALGINYYSPCVVAARPGTPANPAYPGTEGVEFRAPNGPVTAMGWAIEPSALTDLLTRLGRDYPGVPLLVTENGAAFEDKPDLDAGQVADPERTSYLATHIAAAAEAIRLGADLRGYLVWSWLDNFEWAEGYRRRFGLVYVDYWTQRRVLKDSAHWYRGVIERNGLRPEDSSP